METVYVSLAEKSYSIDVDSGNLEKIGPTLASFDRVSKCIVLTDENVNRLGLSGRVAESIADAGIDVCVLTIAAGEQSKAIETAATLWEALLDEGTDRRSVLVAVGGGVIGDLGGFVAATYARGIRFFQVPTTLLAQVDSSVGGKVGIDLPTAKNMVGAFHQPLGVLIDTATLQTLSDDQYASGLGEVVKYGVSLDAELFEFLEANVEPLQKRDADVLRQIVSTCCRIKATIVAQDEFETTGLRALLNYGHTFGHAFESLSHFSLLHGLGVSIGSICAARLAEKLGMVDADFVARQLRLHRALGLPTDVPPEIDSAEVLHRMRQDKKSVAGKLRLVLPTRLGACAVADDILDAAVLDVLR